MSGPRGLPDKLLKSYPRAAGPARTVRPTSATTTCSAGSENHALSPAVPTQNFGLGGYRISSSGSALTAECLKSCRCVLPDKVVCTKRISGLMFSMRRSRFWPRRLDAVPSCSFQGWTHCPWDVTFATEACLSTECGDPAELIPSTVRGDALT